MNDFGLSVQTRNEIIIYFQTIKEIEFVKIFGSRAKGTYKNSSDIDFAVYGEKIDEKLLRHISSELEELPTPYRFDVIDYKAITNEKLKSNIDNYGIVFYQK